MKVHYTFAMYCFGVLLNSSSLDNFLRNLQSCAIVFGSQFTNVEVYNEFLKLQHAFQTLGEQSQSVVTTHLTEGDEMANDNIEEVLSEEEMILTSSKKPFVPFFKAKLKGLQLSTDRSNSKQNPLYQKKWLELMEKKWLAMVPFWTCIIRGLW